MFMSHDVLHEYCKYLQLFCCYGDVEKGTEDCTITWHCFYEVPRLETEIALCFDQQLREEAVFNLTKRNLCKVFYSWAPKEGRGKPRICPPRCFKNLFKREGNILLPEIKIILNILLS
jgi:hypothetical protein